MTSHDTLSPRFLTFLERKRQALALRFVPNPETLVIEVDEAIRSLAGLYERTRNTLEYGEADFLRQRAIERSVRRFLSFGTSPSEHAAFELIRELIRGGYLPNVAIPESVAVTIGRILERLSAAIAIVSPLFHDELVDFAAFEIEDAVFPERAAAQEAMISFAIDTCDAVLRWPKAVREHRSHRAFLFVAVHRALLQANRSRILAAFVREAFPAWYEATPSEIPDLAETFERVLAAAKRTIVAPDVEQYVRSLRRFTAAFQAIDDAATAFIAEGHEATPSSFELERRLEEAVGRRLREMRKKLTSMALRATLYVFLTKMVVGLAIEFPYEYYVLGTAFTRPFFINLFFPPLLMFFVAFSARPPKPAAADRVVEYALELATASAPIEHVRFPRRRGLLRRAMFFLLSFGVGVSVLLALFRWLSVFGFSLVGMGIFSVFLCVVSLFAWRVRKPLRDFAVVGSGGLRSAVVEVFVFPFLAVGRAISDGVRSVNIFLFLLDVFIEAPLKFLFSAAEDWLAFLREKREELIEE
jgi:hypothetical protein